ncbi:MAG TPA: VacJ family lipoprotein [Acidiphilium sp.]|nr:MAG: ABC transporter [Acidiphilium sp. 21-60-14]OYV91006.1 MAG: ABC transporter [Acidiphilium sp. 37-60-79]OZB38929.1 MAG: ABC transporter [Acidiphilium sp. 34-60-192]HQT88577.1 VacJ family lipoprotein [Acidiphilium sp.]HQU24549.1 VacJ family lipoprotein [Acidiphilium sp.]
MARLGVWAVFVGVALVLAGCATPPPRTDRVAYRSFQRADDPLQPTNRFMYRVSNSLDHHVVKPVAVTYIHVTPPWLRAHLQDFTRNLAAPREVIEFMAAGKPRDAGTMLVRFAVNSTVGLGGIFDPARNWGYRRVYTDFGLVLANYGVPEGPYLFVPLSGPSDLRDTTAMLAAGLVSPLPALPRGVAGRAFGYGTIAVSSANQRAALHGTISRIKRTSLDPYAAFRSLYRQRRAADLRRIDRRDVATVPDWYPAPVRRRMRRAEILAIQKGSGDGF